MRRRTLSVSLVAIGVMATAISACGSSSKQSGSVGPGENTFGLSEFAISPPTNSLHAGRISLTAHNVGGEVHELVIVRADSAASLPTKSNGSVDEDKIAASDKVGEIEDVAPQTEKSGTFVLKAGNYVAFCNIVDSMMGSSSSTMMNGGMHGGSGMMDDTSSMHGTSGMGPVHFAEGMSVPFTVS